jgi:hypothetical protein
LTVAQLVITPMMVLAWAFKRYSACKIPVVDEKPHRKWHQSMQRTRTHVLIPRFIFKEGMEMSAIPKRPMSVTGSAAPMHDSSTQDLEWRTQMLARLTWSKERVSAQLP